MRSRLFGLVALGLWVLAHPGAASALELTSEYTSLKDCAAGDSLVLPDRTLERGDQTGIVRCKGAGGVSVYVVDDDPRSFLVLERSGKRFSLEKPMVTNFSLGNFPNVSDTGKAEWRLDGTGKAAGLIVRVSYQRPETGAPASSLFVFDLRTTPTLLGAVRTNEEARDLLDGALGAGAAANAEERLVRDCNAIYAGLCKGFKEGPEMLGRCFSARPEIADKVPPKCIADFQTNIENFHEAGGR